MSAVSFYFVSNETFYIVVPRSLCTLLVTGKASSFYRNQNGFCVGHCFLALGVYYRLHVCTCLREKKLERIDLKWRKSPLELSNLPFHGADFAKKAAD